MPPNEVILIMVMVVLVLSGIAKYKGVDTSSIFCAICVGVIVAIISTM